MGDGNFHLQLRAGSKGLDKDPSLFGDVGFWAKQEVAMGYAKHAESMKLSDAPVCMQLSDYRKVADCECRIKNAAARLERHKETAHLTNFQLVGSSACNVSMGFSCRTQQSIFQKEKGEN
jgi:hypothetical protein